MTALDWMLSKYPEVKEREDMRRIIGRYGLTGQQQVMNGLAFDDEIWGGKINSELPEIISVAFGNASVK